jgi:DNA-binding NarL/FixJ family response regulator
MKPRLLLADDHTLLLEGIRLMLEPEFELVGSVEDGHALLKAAKALKPDIILLDISMPVLNGIDAARRLRKLLPSARLIFLTMHADPDYVAEAFRAGAMGYLLKRAAASELLAAIRAVLKGDHYVSPFVTRNALQSMISSSKQAGGNLLDRLTPRQREVLQLVAEGRSRKEIAGILNISIKTVEFHKGKLMRALNLQTSADFTRYAIEHGIITAEHQS